MTALHLKKGGAPYDIDGENEPTFSHVGYIIGVHPTWIRHFVCGFDGGNAYVQKDTWGAHALGIRIFDWAKEKGYFFTT